MNSVDKDRRSILPKNKYNLLSELNVSAVIEDKQDSLTILQRNITENGNENNLVWISFLPPRNYRKEYLVTFPNMPFYILSPLKSAKQVLLHQCVKIGNTRCNICTQKKFQPPQLLMQILCEIVCDDNLGW